MNIHAQKIELAQQIFNIQKKGTLNKLISLLKSEEPDLWDELPDNIKIDAEIAMQELDLGKGIPHETVMKKYSKWLRK